MFFPLLNLSTCPKKTPGSAPIHIGDLRFAQDAWNKNKTYSPKWCLFMVMNPIPWYQETTVHEKSPNPIASTWRIIPGLVSA